uniref:NADP-dependent oxidoreductase domain-containing protein n=1 Tax=Romanomermis culicivorax TaxID=13658 RepID=A0A915J586_ROMCU
MSKIIKTIEIGKNILMPIMGIGTWEMRDKTVLENVLDTGFAAGYRLIDTGYIYQNEDHIGSILKNLLPKHNIKRSDVFITSKMPMSHHGGKVREAFSTSLSKLQSDHIDLYLVHFPGSSSVKPSDGERLKELRRQTWAQMEKLY